ncbi:MAG: lysine-2,3-aminomutase-like protein [Proteobacteria bacterium]|nr:lysine-2,3-aminomutase-like protein [Pseudomonadota bacterium]
MNDGADMTISAKPLRSPSDLIGAGLVAPQGRAALERVAARYGVAITPDIAQLIDPRDDADPIARQFVPDPAELLARPGERDDPIGDYAHSPVAGIVHRYPDRVLLMVTHVCAAYCRFCFRRETVGRGGAATLSPRQLDAALAYVARRLAIWEVILTGGDPLILSARRLARIVARIAAIDHVAVIRVHTRMPVAAPARVTKALVAALKAPGKATYVVLHANHPRELTAPARAACARLVDAGIPLLSQSVLLRGVNDDAATLAALMRIFVANRIKPYYLHHPDLAPGTAHLRTEIAHWQALLRALHGRHSGLCQPAYVLDIPGGHGKSPIGPAYLSVEDAQATPPRYRVADFNGAMHAYPPAADSPIPDDDASGASRLEPMAKP